MKAISCPITLSQLRFLVHDQKLTDAEIAQRIPEATAKRVAAWKRRSGIETLPRWVRNEVLPIEGRLRSLLVGSMLGDGRLVRRVSATHFMERHCGGQKAYLEWKASIWGSWAGPLVNIPDKRGFIQWGMTTCAHALLNEWQELFYAAKDRGWKRLVPQIVDKVDEFALAVWYLDDGTAGWWPGITFGADEASRQVALAIFEKFGLSPKWCLKVRTTGFFSMERETVAERFINLVKSHVPVCMAYKLGPFGFQGPHFQIRQRLTLESLSQAVQENLSIRDMAIRFEVGQATIQRHIAKHGLERDCKIRTDYSRSR